MLLKMKELDNKCLLLSVEDGIYSIDIHGTTPEIINAQQFNKYEIETLERYETSEYTLEEVVNKLEKIHEILNEDNIKLNSKGV